MVGRIHQPNHGELQVIRGLAGEFDLAFENVAESRGVA